MIEKVSSPPCLRIVSNETFQYSNEKLRAIATLKEYPTILEICKQAATLCTIKPLNELQKGVKQCHNCRASVSTVDAF